MATVTMNNNHMLNKEAIKKRTQHNSQDKENGNGLQRSTQVLSAQISNLYKLVEQTPALLREKLILYEKLYEAFEHCFSGCGLYIVGSTVNGFGNHSSDMDLCLIIPPNEVDPNFDVAAVLTKAKEHLSEMPLIAQVEIISAKVPILQVRFKAPYEKIVVDLNVNNSVTIYNSYLLHYYSSYDPRIRPLFCAIKAWAKEEGINDARQSTLTSYSLVMMVIHYLQCGLPVPLLPSLQRSDFQFFYNLSGERYSTIYKLVERKDTWGRTMNKTSLGELFKGFFDYYATKFDFKSSAISIRLGQAIARKQLEKQHTRGQPLILLAQWHHIGIEEPFLLSNTAQAVFDERMFEKIKLAFKKACTELEHGGDLNTLLDNKAVPSHFCC